MKGAAEFNHVSGAVDDIPIQEQRDVVAALHQEANEEDDLHQEENEEDDALLAPLWQQLAVLVTETFPTLQQLAQQFGAQEPAPVAGLTNFPPELAAVLIENLPLMQELAHGDQELEPVAQELVTEGEEVPNNSIEGNELDTSTDDEETDSESSMDTDELYSSSEDDSSDSSFNEELMVY